MLKNFLSRDCKGAVRSLAIAVLLACAAVTPTLAAETTLLAAAEAGDHAAALRLASVKGASVNTPGADGTTAVMYAAANNDLELVRALIKAGADVKLKNDQGLTAYDFAVGNERTSTAEFLKSAK